MEEISLKDLAVKLINNEVSEYELIDRQLIQEIIYCTSVLELKDVLNNDPNMELPIPTRIILCKRIVDLERNTENLRILAGYLLLHGTSWDDEAKQMLKEADELQKNNQD